MRFLRISGDRGLYRRAGCRPVGLDWEFTFRRGCAALAGERGRSVLRPFASWAGREGGPGGVRRGQMLPARRAGRGYDPRAVTRPCALQPAGRLRDGAPSCPLGADKLSFREYEGRCTFAYEGRTVVACDRGGAAQFVWGSREPPEWKWLGKEILQAVFPVPPLVYGFSYVLRRGLLSDDMDLPLVRSVERIIVRDEKLYIYYCGVHGPGVVRRHRPAIGLLTLRRVGREVRLRFSARNAKIYSFWLG